MSEQLKSVANNTELAPEETTYEDVAEFDPVKAEAARKERVEAYLRDHPNAVKDPRKAMVMAEAGDHDETSAGRFLKMAETHAGSGSFHNAGIDIANAKLHYEKADARETEAGKLYDQIEGIRKSRNNAGEEEPREQLTPNIEFE